MTVGGVDVKKYSGSPLDKKKWGPIAYSKSLLEVAALSSQPTVSTCDILEVAPPSPQTPKPRSFSFESQLPISL
jgi:hypothetical protein